MPGTVRVIGACPDGTRLLVGGIGFDSEVIPIADMQGWRVCPGHTDGVTQVAFSPDGRLLASVAGRWPIPDDKRILLWDAASGKLLRSLAEEDEDAAQAIRCVTFSADGKSIFDGGSEGHIRRRDVQTGKIVQTLNTGMEHVLGLSASPDGRYVASIGFGLPTRSCCGILRLGSSPSSWMMAPRTMCPIVQLEHTLRIRFATVRKPAWSMSPSARWKLSSIPATTGR